MGVYVPNKSMPLSCDKCAFHFWWKYGEATGCTIDEEIEETDFSNRRSPSCPLIYVTKQSERLLFGDNNEELPNLPKLPYGQGSFSWHDKQRAIMRYRVVYKCNIDGKTYRLVADGVSPKECYEKIEDKKRKKDESVRGITENSTKTLSNAMLDWLCSAKSKKRKAASISREERTIHKQIGEYNIGLLQTSKVTSDDINKHLYYLQYKYNNGEGYSYSTVKKTYEVLDQFMRFFYAESPEKNPMLRVSKPTERKNDGKLPKGGVI